MPDNIRFSNPDTMQKPPGYTHVVEVTGPGRTVYFAGQLGIDKSGKMGANAREQMEIAFENVKAALASEPPAGWPSWRRPQEKVAGEIGLKQEIFQGLTSSVCRPSAHNGHWIETAN